jgi:polygalacturonase
VSAIRVFDLSLDGPDNGIRIKSNGSRGGLTHDVKYDDVCVRDSPNPITLDTGYAAGGDLKGDKMPTMEDVTLTNVRVSGGGKISFNGYDAKHRIGARLDNVLITDGMDYKYSLHYADLLLGPGAVNLKFTPEAKNPVVDSTINGTHGNSSAQSCAEKFVPFPVQ